MKYRVNSRLKLRIRKSPTTKSKVVGYLKKGTIIEVSSISNGWAKISKGYVKASLLTNVEALNTATNTAAASETEAAAVTPSTTTNAQKLAELANAYAYKNNDSKAKYPNGKPTVAYKNALEKAYPYKTIRSKWKSKAWKSGASCGVFIGVCIRNAGIDKTFPHYTSKQWKPFADSSKWESIEPNIDNLQTGDIIIYRHGKGGHICMFYDGMIKEASYGDFYPKTTNRVKDRISKDNPKNKYNLKVYRARG